MNISDFVLVTPCAAALIIGFLIKNSISIIPNKFIPMICGIVGLLINIWVNMDINADIVISGLFSGVAATGMFEMVRQLLPQEKVEVTEEKKDEKN